MLYIDKNKTNNLVTVPIIYSGQTHWEFTHDLSGDIFDLVGPPNLSLSPNYWTIDLNGQSFPYSGAYSLRIYKLTGESIWKNILIVEEKEEIINFTKESKKDNVIFK